MHLFQRPCLPCPRGRSLRTLPGLGRVGWMQRWELEDCQTYRLCFVCVSWMIRWYLRDVSVILWWCVKMFSACASDVLVIFKWCVGDVSGVSRWCVVIVLWCFGDMWVMPWFCVGDVSALCRWCFGVSVMGGNAAVMFWWWYCDVNSVMNIDEHFQFFSGFRSKKSGCSMCLCYWGRMLG